MDLKKLFKKGNQEAADSTQTSVEVPMPAKEEGNSKRIIFVSFLVAILAVALLIDPKDLQKETSAPVAQKRPKRPKVAPARPKETRPTLKQQKEMKKEVLPEVTEEQKPIKEPPAEAVNLQQEIADLEKEVMEEKSKVEKVESEVEGPRVEADADEDRDLMAVDAEPETKNEEMSQDPQKIELGENSLTLDPQAKLLNEVEATPDSPIAKAVKEYQSPPDYSQVGRGLVYNCAGSHWACVDRTSYLKCRENFSWHKENKKEFAACVPLDVYASDQDCKTVHTHFVNSLKETGFCKL